MSSKENKVEEEIKKYVDKMTDIYEQFLAYLDNQDPVSEEDYIKLLQIIDKHNIQRIKEQFHQFISLLIKISNEHHRQATFFNKIERILLNFRSTIQETQTNVEIYREFESNKRLIYFLLKEGILTIDDQISQYIKFNEKHFSEFFSFDINKTDDKDDTKRQIGENDSYICSLIRSDAVEEFVQYVNQANFRLSSRIEPSIFETNSFLIDKKPTLIEYAAFFGSIQIFQYLYINKAPISGSLWLYGIHSNNAIFIRNYIERSGIKPTDNNWEQILIESIKCHHNEIARYIFENLIDENIISNISFNERVFKKALKYHNYSFFPTDFKDKKIFFILCQYEYEDIVNILIKSYLYTIEKKIYITISMKFLKFKD